MITALHLAFERYACVEVIKDLVESGTTIPSTSEYPTILHWAVFYYLKADVCQYLLQIVPRDELNTLNEIGQSLICMALRHRTEIAAIKMLLAAGCSLNACWMHRSAFICATAYSTTLTGDLVKVLKDAGSDISITNNTNKTPLQCALRNCRYDLGAIESLLYLQGEDARLEVLLLDAAENVACQIDVFKFLINKGACVNIKDEYGRTPLHLVVYNVSCTLEIVNLLLEHGACVDGEDIWGLTALDQAFNSDKDLDLLELLLKAGARLRPNNKVKIIMAQGCARLTFTNVLRIVLSRYRFKHRTRKIFDTCKLFLKYAFLEDINFSVESIFFKHARECVSELREMQALSSRYRFDLYQCISRADTSIQRQMSLRSWRHRVVAGSSRAGCQARSPFALCGCRPGDFEKVLKILAHCNFKVYFDVIVSRLGRDILELKTKKMTMYTVKRRPYCSVVKLNTECLCKITRYLCDKDLLRLIIAFHFPK